MAATQSKPRKAAAKKSTAPRKAARARTAPKPETNGAETNGSQYQPLPQAAPVPAQPKHPYGENTPIYVFNPSDGSEPIVFPRISTLEVTAKFMWQIYNLNEMFQSFEWMNLAQVPRYIQERVVDLPLADRTKFWQGWFQDITAPASEAMSPPGE